MTVETIVVGPIGTNCYIVYDGAKNAVVIDPGAEGGRICARIEALGLKVAAIYLTHGHFDHITALPQVRAAAGATVLIHGGDAQCLTDPRRSLGGIAAACSAPADALLADGETHAHGGLEVRVMHTPGHTPGSCCFIIDDHMFSGDTLFSGDMGRVDLPGSDPAAMRRTAARLRALDVDYKVMPGHEESTTLFREKRVNAELNG